MPEIISSELEKCEFLDEKLAAKIQAVFVKIDEKLKSDEVIKELFEIAGKDIPQQVEDRDEIRNELDELNEGIQIPWNEIIKTFQRRKCPMKSC